MATLAVTFAFLSDAQSFASNPGTSVTMAWDGSNGNPVGCLSSTRSVKGNSGADSSWTRTMTFEAMGVPTSSVIRSITSASMQSRCTAFTSAGAGNTSGAVTLAPTGFSSITLSTQRSITGTDASFQTTNGTDATGLEIPSGTSCLITISNHLQNTNTTGSTVTLKQDQLTFTITYDPLGAGFDAAPPAMQPRPDRTSAARALRSIVSGNTLVLPPPSDQRAPVFGQRQTEPPFVRKRRRVWWPDTWHRINPLLPIYPAFDFIVTEDGDYVLTEDSANFLSPEQAAVFAEGWGLFQPITQILRIKRQPHLPTAFVPSDVFIPPTPTFTFSADPVIPTHMRARGWRAPQEPNAFTPVPRVEAFGWEPAPPTLVRRRRNTLPDAFALVTTPPSFVWAPDPVASLPYLRRRGALLDAQGVLPSPGDVVPLGLGYDLAPQPLIPTRRSGDRAALLGRTDFVTTAPGDLVTATWGWQQTEWYLQRRVGARHVDAGQTVLAPPPQPFFWTPGPATDIYSRRLRLVPDVAAVLPPPAQPTFVWSPDIAPVTIARRRRKVDQPVLVVPAFTRLEVGWGQTNPPLMKRARRFLPDPVLVQLLGTFPVVAPGWQEAPQPLIPTGRSRSQRGALLGGTFVAAAPGDILTVVRGIELVVVSPQRRRVRQVPELALPLTQLVVAQPFVWAPDIASVPLRRRRAVTEQMPVVLAPPAQFVAWFTEAPLLARRAARRLAADLSVVLTPPTTVPVWFSSPAELVRRAQHRLFPEVSFPLVPVLGPWPFIQATDLPLRTRASRGGLLPYVAFVDARIEDPVFGYELTTPPLTPMRPSGAGRGGVVVASGLTLVLSAPNDLFFVPHHDLALQAIVRRRLRVWPYPPLPLTEEFVQHEWFETTPPFVIARPRRRYMREMAALGFPSRLAKHYLASSMVYDNMLAMGMTGDRILAQAMINDYAAATGMTNDDVLVISMMYDLMLAMEQD